jgi:hypothetical protein
MRFPAVPRPSARLLLPAALLAAVALLATAIPARAQVVPSDSAAVHEVRRGDTLWDLARACLGDPFRWPEIYRMNRGIVADPDLIYPREALRLPACGAMGGAATAARGGAAGATGAEEPERTVFFPREGDTGLQRTLAEEVTASTPVATAGEFYRAGLLVHERDIVPAGTVEEVVSPTVVPIRTAPQVLPNDRVYLRLRGRVEPGDRLHLLRPGREVEPYGRIYHSTGLATVETVSRGVAVVVIDQLFSQVQRGDLAVPMALFRAPEGEAPTPVSGPSGRILAFANGSPVKQLHDLAFVDLGRQFGVKEGDELEAYLPARAESWGVKPEVPVARLKVVRATDRTAAVQVVGMDQPALEAGLPVRLVARTP